MGTRQRQTKTLIAPGIYREGQSLLAEVRIGSSRDGTQTRRRERFPLGTDLHTIIAWQHDAKSDLITAAPEPAAVGSLAADIPRYLETLPDGKYKTESAYLFQHWAVSPLGAIARASITRLDVVGQISAWLDAGVARASVNKRLSRLRKFYAAVDGLDVKAPTDAIKFLREPEQERRDIPTRIVRLILDSLPALGRPVRGEDRPTVSMTKIRLSVMAWTGIPPASLARIRARDLDFKTGRVYLRRRRKGAGADGVWITLLPTAVVAFREFVDAGLLGQPYSNSSMGKTWRVGIKRASHTAAKYATDSGDRTWIDELDNLPPRCRPYDLRHSFGSEMYRRTGDIRAVSELLQHATLEMTKRYTVGAVSERVSAAVAKASAAYSSVPTIPAPAAKKLRLVTR
jgi:integrase